MADNTETTTPEPTENPAETPSENLPAPVEASGTENNENGNSPESSPADETPKETTMTADQALDIAFGVGVLVVEAATTLAKQLSDRLNEVQDQAPAISQALQEKGRPVREKFVSKMKTSSEPSGDSDLSAVADAARDNESGGTIGEMVSPENIVPPAPKTNGSNGSGNASSFLSNIFGLGGNKSVSAEDEINALEQRVRELEQEVTTPDMTPFASAPTPAEEATFTPTPPLETLEESSYAMSETDDEVLAEQVEESIDQSASMDNTPAKPKVSRRKSSTSSANEETSESFPPTEGEDRA